MINKDIFRTQFEIENRDLFLKREWLFYTKENLRRKTFEQENNFIKGNLLLSSFYISDTCIHLIGVALFYI